MTQKQFEALKERINANPVDLVAEAKSRISWGDICKRLDAEAAESNRLAREDFLAEQQKIHDALELKHGR